MTGMAWRMRRMRQEIIVRDPCTDLLNSMNQIVIYTFEIIQDIVVGITNDLNAANIQCICSHGIIFD